LQGLSRPQAAEFTTAIAARMGPIFSIFSVRTPPYTYDGWVQRLRSMASTTAVAEAHRLLDEIREAPEATIDDSNRPEFYAMRVLSTVDYGLRVVIDPGFDEPLAWASRAATSLMRDLDFVRGLPPGSMGSLEGLELDAQMNDVNRTRSNQPVETTVSATVAAAISDACRDVARLRGWLSSDIRGR
jgi:hypothetical protein